MVGDGGRWLPPALPGGEGLGLRELLRRGLFGQALGFFFPSLLGFQFGLLLSLPSLPLAHDLAGTLGGRIVTLWKLDLPLGGHGFFVSAGKRGLGSDRGDGLGGLGGWLSIHQQRVVFVAVHRIALLVHCVQLGVHCVQFAVQIGLRLSPQPKLSAE